MYRTLVRDTVLEYAPCSSRSPIVTALCHKRSLHGMNVRTEQAKEEKGKREKGKGKRGICGRQTPLRCCAGMRWDASVGRTVIVSYREIASKIQFDTRSGAAANKLEYPKTGFTIATNHRPRKIKKPTGGECLILPGTSLFFWFFWAVTQTHPPLHTLHPLPFHHTLTPPLRILSFGVGETVAR